jgi:hypothetical protein
MRLSKIVFLLNIVPSFLAFIPTSIVAPLALFLFDAPESAKNLVNWLLFWSMLTLPIVIGISLLISSKLFKKQKYWLAVAVSSVPYVNIILLMIANSMY